MQTQNIQSSKNRQFNWAIFRWQRKITIQTMATLAAMFFLLPFIITIQISLQGEGLKNYLAVLSLPQIPQFFLNSTITTIGTIALSYCITLPAAYAFSKLQFRGEKFLFNLLLMGMMLPSVVLVVPLFVTIRSLNLFNNYLALILPYTALSLPFNLLLMRNFLDNLPDELLDAARIDGSNSFNTLIKIVFPLSRSVSIVVVIWTFLGAWNEYFLAMIFMQDETHYTITRTPEFFTQYYGNVSIQDTGKVFASLILISVPVIVLYLLLQRYFEDGMTSGALK